MAGIAESMADVFDYTWRRSQDRLAGLTDAEYFWAPVDGCWSVRQASAAAVSFLDRSYHDYWRDKLAGITADRWWQPIGPTFGPYASNSTADLALHVLDEFIHHSAEVGLLRDLYPHRATLGGG